MNSLVYQFYFPRKRHFLIVPLVITIVIIIIIINIDHYIFNTQWEVAYSLTSHSDEVVYCLLSSVDTS